MSEFKVKVGKEEVLVKVLLRSMLVATYKGEEVFIEPVNHGHKVTWKTHVGKMDNKTVQLIGKAIEKYMKDNH